MKIALVTPLRNEADNIDKLFESIASQTTRIFLWVIVENNSTDGSKEKLTASKKPDSVDNLKIINKDFPNSTYELGVKYANVVNIGFEYVMTSEYWDELDFIGILDADCLPEDRFYNELTQFMEMDAKLGISSGTPIFLSGVREEGRDGWVAGNCRLWKKKCFQDAGYVIGPSADTLSVAKAIIKGWKVYPRKDLIIHCRDMGKRVNFKYYGYSVYYRGQIPLYALLRSFKYLMRLNLKAFTQFLIGYFGSYIKKKKRIQDPELLNYFQKYIYSYFSK